MKAFIHNGRTYLRVIPSKFMMNSTMIYDITTRGDILAMDVKDQKLVTIKGTEKVEHIEMNLLRAMTAEQEEGLPYKPTQGTLL